MKYKIGQEVIRKKNGKVGIIIRGSSNSVFSERYTVRFKDDQLRLYADQIATVVEWRKEKINSFLNGKI